jgi:hypothetical protein
MNRLAATVVSLAVLCGCTPREVELWTAWHAKDPAAAEEFAHSLANRTEQQPAGRDGCDGIYDEMIRQGANAGVAQRFAYRIAPRESGCHPQFVHDRDDWSYSRFGLNGLTAGLRANWRAWCGADVRSDTRVLSTDVACALAAYHRMGWQPWN